MRSDCRGEGNKNKNKCVEKKVRVVWRAWRACWHLRDSPSCSLSTGCGSDWKCCGFACFLRDMLSHACMGHSKNNRSKKLPRNHGHGAHPARMCPVMIINNASQLIIQRRKGGERGGGGGRGGGMGVFERRLAPRQPPPIQMKSL